MFVIWSCIRVKGKVSTDRSKAVPLLQFFFVRASVVFM